MIRYVMTALEYNDSEVSQNCNTQEVRELFPTCTDYPPFIFTGSGKSEEESEEDNRKPALAEELKRSPERKRCRKDACPPCSDYLDLQANCLLGCSLPDALSRDCGLETRPDKPSQTI